MDPNKQKPYQSPYKSLEQPITFGPPNPILNPNYQNNPRPTNLFRAPANTAPNIPPQTLWNTQNNPQPNITPTKPSANPSAAFMTPVKLVSLSSPDAPGNSPYRSPPLGLPPTPTPQPALTAQNYQHTSARSSRGAGGPIPEDIARSRKALQDRMAAANHYMIMQRAAQNQVPMQAQIMMAQQRAAQAASASSSANQCMMIQRAAQNQVSMRAQIMMAQQRAAQAASASSSANQYMMIQRAAQNQVPMQAQIMMAQQRAAQAVSASSSASGAAPTGHLKSGPRCSGANYPTDYSTLGVVSSAANGMNQHPTPMVPYHHPGNTSIYNSHFAPNRDPRTELISDNTTGVGQRAKPLPNGQIPLPSLSKNLPVNSQPDPTYHQTHSQHPTKVQTSQTSYVLPARKMPSPYSNKYTDVPVAAVPIDLPQPTVMTPNPISTDTPANTPTPDNPTSRMDMLIAINDRFTTRWADQFDPRATEFAKGMGRDFRLFVMPGGGLDDVKLRRCNALADNIVRVAHAKDQELHTGTTREIKPGEWERATRGTKLRTLHYQTGVYTRIIRDLTRLRYFDSAALRRAPAEHRIRLHNDIDKALLIGREILGLVKELDGLVLEERKIGWDWMEGLLDQEVIFATLRAFPADFGKACRDVGMTEMEGAETFFGKRKDGDGEGEGGQGA